MSRRDNVIQGYNNVWNGFQSGLQSFGNWLFQGNPFAQGISNALDLNGSQAAQQQFNNQLALNQQAQAYNSAEAEKQRQWELNMSSTEMQRRVQDLEAAGLNPYLALGSMGAASAGAGSSASTSSGNADMANNKLVQAAGIIAMVLRMALTKGK